ncbi:MAG: hypothetical protein C0478_05435 [Planctomyces sp.]|nr:hypothetical protein [Planctomyces sp.]
MSHFRYGGSSTGDLRETALGGMTSLRAATGGMFGVSATNHVPIVHWIDPSCKLRGISPAARAGMGPLRAV